MMEVLTGDDAEALVRKTLCSCSLAVDGTITIRREIVPDVARSVASCLASHGLLAGRVDAPSAEKLICAEVARNCEGALPFSVPAKVMASRIWAAMHTA